MEEPMDVDVSSSASSTSVTAMDVPDSSDASNGQQNQVEYLVTFHPDQLVDSEIEVDCVQDVTASQDDNNKAEIDTDSEDKSPEIETGETSQFLDEDVQPDRSDSALSISETNARSIESHESLVKSTESSEHEDENIDEPIDDDTTTDCLPINSDVTEAVDPKDDTLNEGSDKGGSIENGSIKDMNVDSDGNNTLVEDGKVSDSESGNQNSDESENEVENSAVSISDSDETTQDVSNVDTNSRQESNDVTMIDDTFDLEKTGGNNSIMPELSRDSTTILSDTDDNNETEKPSIDSDNLLRQMLTNISNRNLSNGMPTVVKALESNQSQQKNIFVVDGTKNLVDVAVSNANNLAKYNNELTKMLINASANNLVMNSQQALLSMYQNIATLGTSVTPVQTASSNSEQDKFLPNLSDDMFIIEAPSFIVPYVYEKPSVEPLNAFVKSLGKELQIYKDDTKPDQDTAKPEDTVSQEGESVKSQGDEKAEKKGQKNKSRKNYDDDDSWDGQSSSDSEGESVHKTVVLKEKADVTLESIKNPEELLGDSDETKVKSDNYFDNPLGKFFMNIAMGQVQEYIQNDLLRQQKHKLYREKKAGNPNSKATQSVIDALMKNLDMSRNSNKIFKYPMKQCQLCTFQTESSLSLAKHMDTPHIRGNMYSCSYCTFQGRTATEMNLHMMDMHGKKVHIDKLATYHPCPNCPFEDNGKTKLAKHQLVCCKKFKPEVNLSPPVDWEPPAKIPKPVKSRQGTLNTYLTKLNKGQENIAPVVPVTVQPPVPVQNEPIVGAPLIRDGIMYRNSQFYLALNQQLQTIQATRSNEPIIQDNQQNNTVSISLLPCNSNNSEPIPSAAVSITPSPTTFKPSIIICEICDGYMRNLEQLRNHLQWIHKVRVHPKIIRSKPPLNCQKCQLKFFTDQGLERHLLGSHGLVTTALQEANRKKKDGGRCPLCGRVYQWKLLTHVAIDHKVTLKPTHITYKCTVCSAAFSVYKHFESHVYITHSMINKKMNDKKPYTTSATPIMNVPLTQSSSAEVGKVFL